MYFSGGAIGRFLRSVAGADDIYDTGIETPIKSRLGLSPEREENVAFLRPATQSKTFPKPRGCLLKRNFQIKV